MSTCPRNTLNLAFLPCFHLQYQQLRPDLLSLLKKRGKELNQNLKLRFQVLAAKGNFLRESSLKTTMSENNLKEDFVSLMNLATLPSKYGLTLIMLESKLY